MSWQEIVVNVAGGIAVVSAAAAATWWAWQQLVARARKSFRLWNNARSKVGFVLATRYRLGVQLLAPYLEQRFARLPAEQWESVTTETPEHVRIKRIRDETERHLLLSIYRLDHLPVDLNDEEAS